MLELVYQDRYNRYNFVFWKDTYNNYKTLEVLIPQWDKSYPIVMEIK